MKYCSHCGKPLEEACQHKYTYQDADGAIRCVKCLKVLRAALTGSITDHGGYYWQADAAVRAQR